MLPVNLQPEFNIDESLLTGLKAAAAKAKRPETGREDLEKAAKQFEEFMLSTMFKSMYSSVQKSELTGNSFAQDVFMGMFIDESVKKGGLGERGIAAMVMKQYSRHGAIRRPEPETGAIAATVRDPAAKVSDTIAALAADDKQALALTDIARQLSAMTDGLDDKLSSGFGMRLHPIHKDRRFHHGLDFALPEGADLKAAAAGTVTFVGNKGGYGRTVIIDHGHGLESRYAHLSEAGVKVGEPVSRDTRIGKVGSTGLSTGPHLHYEVRYQGQAVDPRQLISDLKNTQTLEKPRENKSTALLR